MRILKTSWTNLTSDSCWTIRSTFYKIWDLCLFSIHLHTAWSAISQHRSLFPLIYPNSKVTSLEVWEFLNYSLNEKSTFPHKHSQVIFLTSYCGLSSVYCDDNAFALRDMKVKVSGWFHGSLQFQSFSTSKTVHLSIASKYSFGWRMTSFFLICFSMLPKTLPAGINEWPVTGNISSTRLIVFGPCLRSQWATVPRTI